MPQFDTATFPSQIFWLVVCFVVVFVFAWRIVLPRIAGTLEDRQRKIGDDLARAGELADQADEVMAAYEKRLAERIRQWIEDQVRRRRRLGDGCVEVGRSGCPGLG